MEAEKMRVIDTDSFIERAKQLHKDTYDYSKTVYTDSKSNVIITCKVHGDFEQNPTNHYTKSGCPKCAKSGYKYSQEEVIDTFAKVHGTTYDYSLVNYKNENTHIDIICKIHGVFKQQPKGHKQGQGCPTCAIVNRTISQNDAISRFVEAHGHKYDYSKVDYTSKDNKVTIICPEHGEFEQRAADHWKGLGCQKCSKNGFDSSLPAFLYYLSINNGEAYKIGITNRTVEARFTITDLSSIEVVETVYFEQGIDAYQLEQSILKKYEKYKYIGKSLLSSGNTELFNTDIRKLNEINTIREL